MRISFTRWLSIFHHSYWFLPFVLVCLSILAALCSIAVDAKWGAEIIDEFAWLQRSEVDGARTMLATLAGAAIGTAGVVFSMTILAVSHAASNYGPRVLLNFLRDRGNQFTLGVFISTFCFCLMVLHSINASFSDGPSFVPHFSIFMALVLAMLNALVLVYFIHHVPDSIDASKIIAHAGEELCEQLDKYFIDVEDNSQSKDLIETAGARKSREVGYGLIKPQLSSRKANTVCIKSTKTGYLQSIDYKALQNICEGDGTQKSCKMILPRSIGDFIYKGEVLAELQRSISGELGDESELKLTEEQFDDLCQYFSIGNGRTLAQDPNFLIDELVQVAARALSPGVNDPFTAILCIDWLSNAVARTIQKRPKSMLDESCSESLLEFHVIEFADIASRVFVQLQSYVIKDFNVSLHCIKVLSRLVILDACQENIQTLRNIANFYKDDIFERADLTDKQKHLLEIAIEF